MGRKKCDQRGENFSVFWEALLNYKNWQKFKKKTLLLHFIHRREPRQHSPRMKALIIGEHFPKQSVPQSEEHREK